MSQSRFVRDIELDLVRLFAGKVIFPGGHPTPESRLEHDDEDPENPLIQLYYSFDMFAPMLNLLQNERPLWLFFNNRNNCGVATGKEAVGEEESDVIRSRDRRRHGL